MCCAMHAAIGSGGAFALAAARALIDIPGWDAMAIGATVLQQIAPGLSRGANVRAQCA